MFSLLTYSKLSAQSTLDSELEKVEAYIKDRNKIAPEVSSVDVAWHLDHLLKVINGINYSLSESDPNEYKYSWKFLRLVVFTAGRFPRGAAKASKSVLPPDTIKTEDIYTQLQEARSTLQNSSDLDKNHYFDHPVFGVLNRDRTLKFVKIHTRHHLRIIRDIVRESQVD